MKTTAQKDIFNECRDTMLRESVVKSVLIGAICGFAASFVIALITWFTDFNGLWLTLGAFVVVTASVSFLLYYFAFRINNKKVAERLDGMGLEERMITMLEYQNDDSYIAKMQRDNAEKAIVEASKRKGSRLVSVKIATAIIVAVSIIGTFGIGMTTITGLAGFNVIPGGNDLFETVFPSESNYATIRFVAGEGCTLDGELEQRVRKGETTQAVAAYAVDGKAFVKWVDEEGTVYSDTPTRFVVTATRDMTYTATLEDVDDVEDDPDYADDPPEQGDGNGDSSGDPNFGDPDDSEPGDPGDPDGSGNGAGSGNNNQNDSIIDGKTDYKEKYDYYYQQAMQKLANGEEIPPELREIIEGYFEILNP